MKKGDFVKIDFTGKVADTGEVFDLTSEEEARKEGIFNEKQTYGPTLVIVGSGMVIPGLEEKLLEMNVGEEKEFDIEPSRAFGPRSPKLMKIMSLGKFLEKKINPVPGLFVDIDGMQARVKSVSGGRVMVDFNHPLAGKRLHYRLKLVSQVTEPLEKVKSMLDYYGIKAEPSIKEGILTIKAEKELPKPVHQLLEKSIKEWVKEVREIKF